MAGPKLPRRPGVPVRPAPVRPAPVRSAPARLPVVTAPRAPVSVGAGSGREYAERLVQTILARKARVAEQFYAMGAELRELARPECFRALGYGTFVELIEGRKIVSRMTALRLMSVAGAFPRELATELGLEKAYALVRYAEATPAADVARALAERNAVVGGKSVREATVREIEAETKRIRSGGRVRNPRDAAATEARGAARAIQKALRRAGGGAVTARGVWEDGQWQVRIELTAGEARALVKVL